MVRECKHKDYRISASRVGVSTLESCLGAAKLPAYFKLIIRQEKRSRNLEGRK